MNAADVIAYTADAAAYCPGCAREIYGPARLGECPDCGRYLAFPRHGEGECHYCGWAGKDLLVDGEGNEVHPVFAEEEWAEGLWCSQCGDVVVEPDEGEDE